MPRPITELTDEQRRLLADAVNAANEKHAAKQRAGELEEAAWARILEARAADVPDDLLCKQTGFSRATLNRKFGSKRGQEDSRAVEGDPAAE